MKVDGPGPVPEEALRYFRAKVNLPGFDHRDVWREEHASAFTVAKAMQMDVLDSIRQALDDNLASGKTMRDFEKHLTPTLQSLGWWGRKEMVDPVTGQVVEAHLGSPRRLRTIYRANMATARTAGQWERAQRTKAALPYLLYELGPSKEHRPEHAAWHGTLLPVDDPWWDTHMPRNGWGCRCEVRQVGRSEYGRLTRDGVPGPITQVLDPETGKPTGRITFEKIPAKTTAPPIQYVDWKNKRTGRVEKVPKGIDPGWDTNPGKVRQQSLERLLAGKINALSEIERTVAVKDLAASGRFGRWVDGVMALGQARGQVQIVGAIDKTTRAFLESKGEAPEVDVIEMADQGVLHSLRDEKSGRGAAISIEDMRKMPEHLLKAEKYWDSQDPALVYAFDVKDDAGKTGKAVVHVNYKTKRQTTNRVVTTGLVQPENLEDPRYEKIGE